MATDVPGGVRRSLNRYSAKNARPLLERSRNLRREQQRTAVNPIILHRLAVRKCFQSAPRVSQSKIARDATIEPVRSRPFRHVNVVNGAICRPSRLSQDDCAPHSHSPSPPYFFLRYCRLGANGRSFLKRTFLRGHRPVCPGLHTGAQFLSFG